MFQEAGEVPLIIGDFAQINSGGPVMVIVDSATDSALTVSYRDDGGEVHEHIMPRECLHRAR